MTVSVSGTQTSRENELTRVVASVFPELHLTSRHGPALRFERVVAPGFLPKWIWDPKPVGSEELHVFTIEGKEWQKGFWDTLDLRLDWIEMSIHLFAPEFREKASQLAQRISELTGKDVAVVLEK